MKQETLAKLEFGEVCRHLADLTTSPLGRKAARHLRPETSFLAAKDSLRRTEEALWLIDQGLEPTLEGLVDLDGLLIKLSKTGSVPHPRELYYLREALLRAKDLRRLLGPLKAKVPQLYRLTRQLSALADLSAYLSTLLNEKGNGLKDSASPLLKRLRKDRGTLEERIRETMRACLRQAARRGILQEELITVRNGRYVLPIRAEARGSLAGILHDVSQSGATVYIEPLEVVGLTNELYRLELEEEREVERLLTQAAERIRPYLSEIKTNLVILAEVDLVFAKARWGRRIKGAIPRLVSGGALSLYQAAHPLLLLKDPQGTVRNDFLFPAEKQTVLITGPNMGGKTVALKTVGLLVLMAQAGIPIAASADSELPFFSQVLVDIGDEQDLAGDQSTFSAHLHRLKEFLEEAREDSLVLIDEIGRGTDPEEGAALAMAIMDKLRSQKALTVATSHYEAIKAYALSCPEALPISVGFDEHTGRPTYKLLYGLSGRSRAFELALNLGLPAAVIDRARGYLSGKNEKIDSLLAALEEEKKKLLRRQEELEVLFQNLEQQKAQLEIQKESLIKERHQLREDYESRLRRFFQEVDQEVKAWLRSLSRRKSSQGKARATYQALSRAWHQQAHKEMTALGLVEDLPFRPQEGAPVHIISLRRDGLCLKLDDERALVQIGLFKTEVPLEDLAPPKDSVAHSPPLKGEGWRVQSSGPIEVPSRLNVIGLTVDEAIPLIDQALDRAFLSGRPQLTIVHGLGTGRLARAIKEHLKGHRQVAGFRPGERHEGGGGVTIVDLALGGN